MVILAHRGNQNGAVAAEENTVPAFRRCLEQSWGIEVDIRRTREGQFYLSHDPLATEPRIKAEALTSVLQDFPRAIVALNIKETGYERELVAFLRDEGWLKKRLFLFDMELIESQPGHMAYLFREFNPTIGVAARVSDRNEPIDRALRIPEATIIWLDEFDRLWVTEDDVRRLSDAGKIVLAVSPELHGFSDQQMMDRWGDFRKWKVEGICTDFPKRLSDYLGKSSLPPWNLVEKEGS
ncbi:MAG: hypothetical protein HYY57_05295 [Candidatus Omnitrophica bacterium]|nr:hypothetical protein [Candidatus Omnitrophota bacterium]